MEAGMKMMHDEHMKDRMMKKGMMGNDHDADDAMKKSTPMHK